LPGAQEMALRSYSRLRFWFRLEEDDSVGDGEREDAEKIRGVDFVQVEGNGGQVVFIEPLLERDEKEAVLLGHGIPFLTQLSGNSAP